MVIIKRATPTIIGKEHKFPSIDQALDEPNGLLAIGGDLSKERLLLAYRRGIFPWYCANEPILWWSPDPRLIIRPAKIKISKSLKKLWKQKKYKITIDQAFKQVIKKCQTPRQSQKDTWITQDMLNAYTDLHNEGYAHSVEIWESNNLVGGLYGVALGRAFFGESMFSEKPNTSKLALVALARQLAMWHFELIDCQVSSDHLRSMGGIEISRQKFASLLARSVEYRSPPIKWTIDENFV